MPAPEITQSELVRAFVELGTLVLGTKPIEERMQALCATATVVLRCDHAVIMVRDGDRYLGKFQFGLPPQFAQRLDDYVVDRAHPIVEKIEACDSYLRFNRATTDPAFGRIATALGINAATLVPFDDTEGEPLGYLTASYVEDRAEISVEEAELAMGLARVAQTTYFRHLETERRRQISQAMLQVADSERRRLSRDIHDDPLQRILGLRIGLEGFREQVDKDMQPTVDQFIEQCRTASASLREVMLRTHPNTSELADLEQVLTAMVDRGESGSDVRLHFDDNRTGDSPSYLIPAINRIAEQAARNTMRHAHADQLWVQLMNHNDGTLLEVRDDGIGFDAGAVDTTRLGLVSMRERTELLDGTFTLETKPGEGTLISAWFPHDIVDALGAVETPT